MEEVCEVGNNPGIQDILCGLGYRDGLDMKKVSFSFSHIEEKESKEKDYSYYTKDKLERETFAHFFEAGMDYNTKNLQELKKYFPTAYKLYQKMLEDALG